MRPYDPHKPVLFTHIPKCAGSSFIRLLRQWFGKEYFKLNQDEKQDILLPRVEVNGNTTAAGASIRCIHGHFDHGRGYGLPYYYPEIDQYFTIFRDPFDIVVSMYFFAKGRSREGRFWYRGQQVNILDEYPTVDHYLNDYPYWLYNHLPQDLTLANYRDKLHWHFVYIGVQEHLEISIRNLGTILGKPALQLERYNQSNYDEPVPERQRQRFYDNYPLLRKIYDFACATYNDPSQWGTTRITAAPSPAGGPPRASEAGSGSAPASAAGFEVARNPVPSPPNSTSRKDGN